MAMIRNYLKTSLRNIAKNKLYALVSILGLATGMACFILTALFVKDELSFDRWHKNGDHIYTVQVESSIFPGFRTFPPVPYLNAILDESSAVVNGVNIGFAGKAVVKSGDKLIEEEGVYSTQQSIFEMFDFTFKMGDSSKALEDIKSIVLSSEMADKYFPEENPIGRSLELIDKGTYIISGVLDPIPSNSHLQFNFLIPYDFNSDDMKELKASWRFGTGMTYVQLAEEATLDQVIVDTEKVLKKNIEKEKIDKYTFKPFTDLYLTNETLRRSSKYTFGGDLKYVYIFGSVGLIILLVACFNYVNMATAWGMVRVKEVGIRKTIGAHRKQLVGQFLSESTIITLFSAVLAIVLVEGALPSVNNLIGKELNLNYLEGWQTISFFVALILIIGFTAGIYPALVLSSQKVTSLVKGSSAKTNHWLRKGLIVIQFCGCAGLLIASLIIKKQLNYLLDKDMGFNGEQVLNLKMNPSQLEGVNYLTIKSEIEKLSSVTAVSGSPVPGVNGIVSIKGVEGAEEKADMIPYILNVDRNFLDFFEIEVIEGKGLKSLLESEEDNSIIVNEAFAKQLGLTEIVGKKIREWTVAGVVNDFHFMSTKEEIKPVIIQVSDELISGVHVKFEAENVGEILDRLEGIWDQFVVNKPFDYSFMDDAFAATYEKERKVSDLFNYFSIFILVISCLGLFGLTAFISEQSKKEMGIRKVLGASASGIFSLLTKKFIGQIILAAIMAVPIAYYLVEQWLESFPYRVSFGATEGLVGIGVLIVVSLITVTYHGVKSGRANPVNSIRHD